MSHFWHGTKESRCFPSDDIVAIAANGCAYCNHEIAGSTAQLSCFLTTIDGTSPGERRRCFIAGGGSAVIADLGDGDLDMYSHAVY